MVKLKRLLARLLSGLGWLEIDGLICFSQGGEDLIMSNLFSKTDGYYVDIGAHHPTRFSNTFLFYRQGWSGLCIDPLPGSKELFLKKRPRDKFLSLGVGQKKGSLTYYRFDEPALNTFCGDLVDERIEDGYKLVDKMTVPVLPLRLILAKHLVDREKIDILNIDAEGMDEEILRSNDWQKYRPKVVCVEIFSNDIVQLSDDKVVKFLQTVGYKLVAKTINTAIFVNEKEG